MASSNNQGGDGRQRNRTWRREVNEETGEVEVRDRFHGQGSGYMPQRGRQAHIHPDELDALGVTSHATQMMQELIESFPPAALEAITTRDPVTGERIVRTLTPAEAVRLAEQVHGARYAQEFTLRTLHRLLLRNVPSEQIARMFDVTVMSIYRWKRVLRQRLADEVSRLDPNPLVGDAMAFFNEVRGVAMQSASMSSDPKVSARFLDVALRAEAGKMGTLQAWNVTAVRPLTFDASGYKNAEEAKGLQDMVSAILKGEEDGDVLAMLDGLGGGEEQQQGYDFTLTGT